MSGDDGDGNITQSLQANGGWVLQAEMHLTVRVQGRTASLISVGENGKMHFSVPSKVCVGLLCLFQTYINKYSGLCHVNAE